jgi:hypothetical protein
MVLDQIFGRYPCAIGSLRRYQHERLGIIATLTIAAARRADHPHYRDGWSFGTAYSSVVSSS